MIVKFGLSKGDEIEEGAEDATPKEETVHKV